MTLRPAHLASALFALVSSALAFASGCSSAGGSAQCRSNCAAASHCPGAAMVDCSQECADLETLNDASDPTPSSSLHPKAGCWPTYDALLSCEAGLSNACDPSACATQSGAYQACANTYCMTNQAAAGCSHFGW